jgi:tetrahydromethanopterin S-methyltransferase subunit G
MPRQHYCWKLNEETRDWVNLAEQDVSGSNPVDFAAKEIERMFRVKSKPEGWKCQAYYLYEAFKKLTTDEQIKAQKNAGEIDFNSSTGFPITGWWASKGVSLGDDTTARNPVFSFISPSSEDLEKKDYFHGQYVTEDVLEFYLLGMAYKSEKPIPTTARERLAFLQDIEKKREATRDDKENWISRMEVRLAEVKGEESGIRGRSDVGVLCSEKCESAQGKPCAVRWVEKKEKEWVKAGGVASGHLCELLYLDGALENNDVPRACKLVIEKCPLNDLRKRVGEVEKKLAGYKSDVEFIGKDLDTLSERIEAMQTEARTRTGDSRESSNRRSKPLNDSTNSETGRRNEGAPAE